MEKDTNNSKPKIIVFEYINDDGLCTTYHTDGVNMIGPYSINIISLREPIEKNQIQVSYLINEDPDSENKVWHQKICKYCFDVLPTEKQNVDEFKDALADIILEYKAIYNFITGEFPYEKVVGYDFTKFTGYPTLDGLREKLVAL